MQIRLTPKNEEPLKALAIENRRTPTVEANIAIEEYLERRRQEAKAGKVERSRK